MRLPIRETAFISGSNCFGFVIQIEPAFSNGFGFVLSRWCRQSYCGREDCRVKYYVRGENIGTETRCREFKLGRGDLDTHLPCAVSKYVSSFLNSEGGTLMLGVNDKGKS